MGEPNHMGVSNLRVLNDDRVQPGQGFARHGHRDMEIVSVVLSGALEHQDSLGNGSVIRPGDVQRMSAGSGVLHSEFNPSAAEPVHFLQIWLQPNRKGVAPAYTQKHFSEASRRGRWCLLVSPDGRDGSIATHQDALLYASLLESGEAVAYAPAADRQTYVHVARGKVRLNDQSLGGGDGARISAGEPVRIRGSEAAEVLLFDLP
jgi:redox-sensitive bicupin YhaK (pirin superfamily)